LYNHKVAYWATCSINKGKQNGNNKLCHPQGIFLSFIWHASFIEIFNNKCFLVYQHGKTCFWTKCLNESNNFQKNWWNISSYIIFIFHLDFHTRISPITSFWNIFIIFHTLWWVLFWSKYTITYKIFIFYWIVLKN